VTRRGLASFSIPFPPFFSPLDKCEIGPPPFSPSPRYVSSLTRDDYSSRREEKSGHPPPSCTPRPSGTRKEIILQCRAPSSFSPFWRCRRRRCSTCFPFHLPPIHGTVIDRLIWLTSFFSSGMERETRCGESPFPPVSG